MTSTAGTEDRLFKVLKRRPAREVWNELNQLMKEKMRARNVDIMHASDPEIKSWLDSECWDVEELRKEYAKYLRGLELRFD